MAATGKVDLTPKEIDIEWKIQDFLSLPIKEGSYLSSPEFKFAGASWCLYLYPNGDIGDDSVGFIDIYLVRQSPGLPINVKMFFSLKSVYGMREQFASYTYVFNKTYVGYGATRYLSRAVLLKRKSELLPSDALTVVFTLKYPRTIEEIIHGRLQDQLKLQDLKAEAAGTISGAETTQRPETTSLTTQDNSTLNTPRKCLKCSDVIDSEKWYDHKCLMTRAEAIEKLLRDLKRLMLSGDHCDTKLRVQMEEFRLHKCILSARNPSFEMMFKKELRQQTADTVHITDCEPEQFRSLIHYIYTGTADKLSPENVFSLYEVAERYQEEQLKAECLQIMNNSISVDNFCDIIILALKDNEQQLLKAAVEFFPCKAKEIIRSVKWKSFVKKYPEQACELHMKALDCDNK